MKCKDNVTILLYKFVAECFVFCALLIYKNFVIYISNNNNNNNDDDEQESIKTTFSNNSFNTYTYVNQID